MIISIKKSRLFLYFSENFKNNKISWVSILKKKNCVWLAFAILKVKNESYFLFRKLIKRVDLFSMKKNAFKKRNKTYKWKI